MSEHLSSSGDTGLEAHLKDNALYLDSTYLHGLHDAAKSKLDKKSSDTPDYLAAEHLALSLANLFKVRYLNRGLPVNVVVKLEAEFSGEGLGKDWVSSSKLNSELFQMGYTVKELPDERTPAGEKLYQEDSFEHGGAQDIHVLKITKDPSAFKQMIRLLRGS